EPRRDPAALRLEEVERGFGRQPARQNQRETARRRIHAQQQPPRPRVDANRDRRAEPEAVRPRLRLGQREARNGAPFSRRRRFRHRYSPPGPAPSSYYRASEPPRGSGAGEVMRNGTPRRRRSAIRRASPPPSGA